MQNWIKCSERMPEDYTLVLLYDKCGEMWVGYRRRYGQFVCNGCSIANITHWQPLPEPPQE